MKVVTNEDTSVTLTVSFEEWADFAHIIGESSHPKKGEFARKVALAVFDMLQESFKQMMEVKS